MNYQGASSMASTQQTSAATMLDQMQEPLQVYALPHLSAKSLAALRAACKSLQRLVDLGHGAAFHSAARSLLPPALLKLASSSLEVQGLLP